MENYEVIVAIVLGILALLFGLKIKKLAFFVAWFLLGYSLMSYFLPYINSTNPGVAGSELYQVLLPIGGGIILSFMGASVEKFCVSALVFGLSILIGIQYFGTSVEVLSISALVGLILGVFAVRAMKPAIILATSGIGAYILTMVILDQTSIDSSKFYFPILIGLVIIGAAFQFVTNKGKR